LPRIGVSTDELSRKPVAIHVTQAAEVPNSRWKNGSAGTTRVCITANEIPATVSSASVMP
jgi:hypothetical protein